MGSREGEWGVGRGEWRGRVGREEGEGGVGKEEWRGRRGEWGVGREESTRQGHEALPRGARLPLFPSEVQRLVPNNVHNSFVTGRQAER